MGKFFKRKSSGDLSVSELLNYSDISLYCTIGLSFERNKSHIVVFDLRYDSAK